MANFMLPFGAKNPLFGGGIGPSTAPIGSGLYELPDEYANVFGAQQTPFPMGSGLYGQPAVAKVAQMLSQKKQTPIPTQPQQVAPPTGEDKFAGLFSNPMFVFGMNLLGSSTSPNPWGGAINNTLASMAQAAQMKQAQAGQDLAQKKFDLEERGVKIKEQALPGELEIQQAQAKNLAAESDLHAMQAQIAQRQQEMVAQYLGQLGGQAPQGNLPAQGSLPTQGGLPAQGNLPAQGGLPAGISPEALQADLIFNQGKGIPGMMAKANEPISGANGIMYRRGPNNSIQIDPTSMEAYRQMQGIEKGTSAALDLVRVPVEDNTEVMMPRSQAAQMLGGQQTPSNNFGNIRPVGASTGFQSFSTPEEGVAAIDKLLQVYGKKGVNTLRGVLEKWSPRKNGDKIENDTDALIASAAKRLGLNPDQKIDLANPAVRQTIGSAIMLQEQGGKLFAPRLGRTAPQSQTIAGQQLELEKQRTANETAKTSQQLKGEQAKVSEAQAKDTENLQSTLDSFDRMIQGIDSLAKFDKNGKAIESHPGTKYITGLTGMTDVYRLFPEGRDAAAQAETLRNQLMVDTMNLLRSSSETGSTGMGPLNKTEGETLRGIVGNLNLKSGMSTEMLQKQLKTVREFAERAKVRLQNKYNTLYKEGSPNVSPSIGPTAPFKGMTPQQDTSGAPGNVVDMRELLKQKRGAK